MDAIYKKKKRLWLLMVVITMGMVMVAGALLWILSLEGTVTGLWANVMSVVFTFLGVLYAQLQWLAQLAEQQTMDRRAPLFWWTLPMPVTSQFVQASVPNSGANSVRGEHLCSLLDPSVRASPPMAPSGVPVPDMCPLITREVSCVSPSIRCVLTVPCACPMISSALIVSSDCQSGPFTLGASVGKMIEFEKNARFSDCRSLTRSATVSRISSSYPTALQWADRPSTA